MNRELFEKNCQWLKKGANAMEEESFEFSNPDWVPTGDDCYGIEVNGKYWNLASAYGMEVPVSAWMERDILQTVEYNSAILMFGFGNPLYYCALREKFADNMILLVEPSERLIQTWAWFIDFEELFSDKRFILLIGPVCEHKITDYLAVCFDYSNVRNAKSVCVPNYLQMYTEDYKQLMSEFSTLTEDLLVARNTLLRNDEDWSKNSLYALYDLSTQYSAAALFGALEDSPILDYPVVIVAAGPSLEGNIDALKPYQDRAVIIGINRSIKILEAHGIKSHLNVMIDPATDPAQAGEEEMREVPLLTMTSASAEFHQVHNGKRFYFMGDSFVRDFLSNIDAHLPGSGSGGSVATTAFVAAIRMGFKNIILIGQDLAFKDGQQYSMQSVNEQWVFVDEVKEKTARMEEGCYLVDGNNGDKVVTKYDYDHFRLWYERTIEQNPDVHVINATEGGALIHGTEVMSLADALKRDCPEEPLTLDELLADVSPMCVDSKEKYLELLGQIEEDMPSLIKELENGKEIYEKLDKLVKNKAFNHPNLNKNLRKVSELNSKLEKNTCIMFLEQFDVSSRYAVFDALNEKTGDEESEIKLIVEQGLQAVNDYLKAHELWRATLDEVKEMHRAKGTIE